MKKEFILAGLLAVGFASAQTDKDYLGKIGINIMTPQATMDIRPNDDNRQEIATTNEGILIPKLSKTRVANIKDVLLVEGTLAYVTDDASSPIAAYAGTNAKVAKITEKGYYYYNGVEWVKVAIGANATQYTGSTSVVLSGTSFQRAALTGDVTATANSNTTVIANNAVTSAKIADGQVALADLAANSVDSSKIVDKSIVAADLNQMGATDGQVLKYNAATNTWAPAADANTNTTYTGSTSVALSGNSFQRAALTGDVTAAANSNATTIAPNAVTSAKIADGQVALADLAVNSVDSSKIVDKSIVAADLNQMGAANGQVLKWNGTAWAPAADANDNTTYTGSTSVALSGNSFQRAALTGDVIAAANSNATTVARIQGRAVANTAPTNGQVLKWNGTAWAPAADANTADTSIYANNGTLTGARTVNMNGNNLLFTGKGNIAIGTNAPTAKLDVAGNARIRQMPDATTQESTYTKAVVADANGNLAIVSRTNPTVPNSTQTIFGTKAARDVMQGDTFYSIQINNSRGNHYFRYTGQSITLPPGKWIVYNSYLLNLKNGYLVSKIDASNNIKSHSVWVRGIIDDNPNNVLKTDYIGAQINGSPTLVSTNISPDQKYSVATGLWFVDNTTSTYKTYYVKVSFEAFNFTTGDQQTIDVMSTYREDYLVAIRRD